jgi:AcrR family transcriptional regulator
VNGVGVGKGVFYWYFESKNQLLREILREALRDIRQTQAEAAGTNDDPLAQVEAGLRASITWTTQHPDIMQLVRFASSDPEFGPEVRKGRDIMANDVAQVLDAAIERGRIADGDTTIMALAIRAVIDQVSYDHMADIQAGAELDPKVVETVVRTCLRGIQG